VGDRRDGTAEIPPRYEHAPFPHGERQRGTTILFSPFGGVQGLALVGEGGFDFSSKIASPMRVRDRVDHPATNAAQQVSDLHPVVQHTAWKKCRSSGIPVMSVFEVVHDPSPMPLRLRPCLAISGREGVSDVVRKNTSTTSDGRLTAFHHLRSLTGPEVPFGPCFVRPEDLIVFGGLAIHQTASYRFSDLSHVPSPSLCEVTVLWCCLAGSLHLGHGLRPILNTPP